MKRLMPLVVLPLVVLPLAIAGCGPSEPVVSPPVSGTFGVFTVEVAPDSANLDILGPERVPLVDGIDASSDVGMPASDNDDAPPMTGFAVRDVATSYEMQFGSFKIVDAPNGGWRVAAAASWTGGGAPVVLVDTANAKLATLAFSAKDDPHHLVVDVAPGDGAERRFSWGFSCAASDHFLGFGEQTWGSDARGETIPIWVQEEGIHKDLTTDDARGAWQVTGRRHSSYMPMPELLSSRGYAAVAESNRLATFAMCSERADVARLELTMPVRVHFFWGPTPAEAIGRKSGVFGRPRVPPAFAFAPWNDAIFDSANVRRVAKKLRDNGIPSSVIWTEDWRGGEFVDNGGVKNRYALNEEWDVDRTLYPDFEAVAQELHAAGFKWLVYFNSFVEKDSKAWPETAPQGYLIKGKDGQPYLFNDAKFKPCSLVDFSNPGAVAWAVGKMQAALGLGADGWMGDFGEWLPTDAVLAAGSALEQHDAYPVAWQKAQRQALDTMKDGVERLMFVRSGWFGSPGLVDVLWAGDQQTDWGKDDGFPTVIPMALGSGVAGMSTFGSDIAGYQNLNSPTSSKELFFRWTELGAWMPVMRTHHGTLAKSNWSFESDDETLAHWARYAKLHIALAPYLKALAQEAHDTGVAIVRPASFLNPGEAVLWPVADEFLLGPLVLVAPITAEGATSRKVLLPPGRWYPWSGGAPATSGSPSWVDAKAAVGEIPVYARGGAIVPTYPDGVDTLTVEASSAKNAAGVAGDRVVFAFAGEPGTFAEIGAASYALSPDGNPAKAAGAGAARWNGASLAACAASPTAPCVEASADGVRAHVAGPGKLEVTRGGAKITTLTVSGGGGNAAYVLVVRY